VSEIEEQHRRLLRSERVQVSASAIVMYVLVDGTAADGRPFNGTPIFEKQ
jgi:hypothetical protein